jgi:hypothetical protein
MVEKGARASRERYQPGGLQLIQRRDQARRQNPERQSARKGLIAATRSGTDEFL